MERQKRDKELLEPYKILEKGAPKRDSSLKDKQKFVDAIEFFCNAFIRFNPNILKAENGNDFYSDPRRYVRCREMAEYAKNLAGWLPYYQSMTNMDGITFAFTEDEVKELRKRAEAIKNADKTLKQYEKIDVVPETEQYEFDDDKTLLLIECIEKKKGRKVKTDKDTSLDKLKKNPHVSQRAGAVRMVVGKTLYSYAQINNLHRNLSVNEREKKMKGSVSRLGRKVKFADAIDAESKTFRNETAKRRRDIGFSSRSMVSEDEFITISAFFEDESHKNALLTRGYAENRDSALDRITEKFMELSIDELDLSTDDSLLLNIVKLEEVSSKVQNYKRLIEVNPVYVDRLKAVDMGGVNLYDMVKKRIDEFSAVSDYYRARKLLLTNSYFVSHYDDEVAPTYRDDDTKEQKEVSALIMLCSKLAKNMENVFGNNAVGPRVDHPDYLEMVRNNEDMYQATNYLNAIGRDGFATGEYLTNLEKRHRMRAYRDGRMNLSLCTTDGLNKMAKEIETLKGLGLELEALRTDSPGYRKALKKVSPATAELLKFYHNRSTETTTDYTEKNFGNLYKKLLDIRNSKKGSRNRKYDNGSDFKDGFKKESYAISTNMDRLIMTFCRMAYSEGLSDEEAIEIFEGLSIQNWKDVDMSNPAQVERAKDTYFKSVAKFYTMYYEHHMRFINTYGLVPDQMPAAMLALAMPDSFGEIQRRIDGANFTDLSLQGYFKADGRDEVNLLDVLAEKNYLTREFADSFKNLASHAADTHMNMGAPVDDMITYIRAMSDQNAGEGPKFEYNQGLVDDQIQFREQYNNMEIPRLSEDEELDVWKKIHGATALSKDSFKELEKSNLKVLKKESASAAALIDLEKYKLSLEGVDTGGHSEKYALMSIKLTELMEYMKMISRNNNGTGKNVTPANLHDIRTLYSELIDLTTKYLSGKNRNHWRKTYRRRYDIVDDMLQTIKKDYEIISGKNYDRSYNLADLLTEGREETIEAGDEIEFKGSMNVRHMFTRNVEGVDKNFAFTKRKKLEFDPNVTDRYNELMTDTKESVAFPEFAWIATHVDKSIIEAFFRRPENITFFRQIRDKKLTEENIAVGEQRIEEELYKFFDEIWKKYGVYFSASNESLFPPKSGNALLGVYKSFTKVKRRNVVKHIISIGGDYIKNYLTVDRYSDMGIGLGANLDKRNVAMTIVSKETGIGDNIAYSSLAKVKLNEDKKAGDGVITEWINGLTHKEVLDGIKSGEIVCDNEGKLIEQLSDIQINDYICANGDRTMDNIMFEMEETGQKTAQGKPIHRIKRIVGIDNDMSFGRLNPENIKDYIGTLCPPERMQVISRRTADNLLSLDKDRLFIKLGSTITQSEKDSMWKRVLHLQQAIRKADTDRENSTLKIIETENGFKNLTLKGLGEAGTGRNNIYKQFSKDI